MTNGQMGDKEFLSDSLASQKAITSVYNTFASECVNTNLRQEFLSILKEEHDISNDIFEEMQKRGWYKVEQADQNKIQQSKMKFASPMMQ